MIIPYKLNKKLHGNSPARFGNKAWRKRHVIEHCFGFLKQPHRITTRFEKTVRNNLVMATSGGCQIKGHCPGVTSDHAIVPGQLMPVTFLSRLILQSVSSGVDLSE